MTAYRQILARHRNVQYPPEVQVKLPESAEAAGEASEIQARQSAEIRHASDHGGS